MKVRPPIDGQDLDRVVHEPARLVLLLHLAVVDVADYTWLQQQTKLTAGNLGAHLTKLEKARYVTVSKTFADNRPRTEYQLSPTGRTALEKYVTTMRTLLDLAR